MGTSRLNHAGLPTPFLYATIIFGTLLVQVTTTVHPRRHHDALPPYNCNFLTQDHLQCHDITTQDLLTLPRGVDRLTLVNVTGRLQVGVKYLQWVDSNVSDVNAVIEEPTGLVFLDLSGNKVRSLKNHMFTNYSGLKTMNLSNNKIDDLPRNVFENLNLGVLRLSHNQLTAIPFQVFAPMERLRVLDLSHNGIVTILDHFFKFNRYIEELLLNNNNVTKLTSNALADLTQLRRLDLSTNALESVAKGLFDALNNLEYLNLANNPISNVPSSTFRGLTNLRWINLSNNKLKQLTFGLFHFSPRITSLTLDSTEIEILHNSEFLGLPVLEELKIRNNKRLIEIEPYVLADTPLIKYLDISGNSLTFLPLALANLTQLKSLNIEDNPWACDCRMYWFATWAQQHKNVTMSELSCGPFAYPNDMLPTLNHLNCTIPRIIYKTPTNQYRLKSNALLECRYAANPLPSITWITPRREVYHWNPDPAINDVFHKHPHAHDEEMIPLRTIPPRIQVLDNGTLYIQNVTREDCGRYTCYASNPIANITDNVLLYIDPTDWNYVRIISLIVGAQCAAGFLGITLLVQFLRYVLNK